MAANRLVEPIGDGQYRVAPGFYVQPAAIHSPHESVARVFVKALRVKTAALLIGRREHDCPVQRLDRPS